MSTTIIPLIKNKAGDNSDANNYRPIALVTIFSKIFETILLDILDVFLHSNPHQFDFKKKHYRLMYFLT